MIRLGELKVPVWGGGQETEGGGCGDSCFFGMSLVKLFDSTLCMSNLHIKKCYLKKGKEFEPTN